MVYDRNSGFAPLQKRNYDRNWGFAPLQKENYDRNWAFTPLQKRNYDRNSVYVIRKNRQSTDETKPFARFHPFIYHLTHNGFS